MAGHPTAARSQVAGLRPVGAAVACLAVALAAGSARAGAWPLAPGENQLILKYEAGFADRAYDPDGVVQDIPERRESYLSAFYERGLTDRLTLQARVGATQGRDQFVDYEGRGPSELGVRWAAIRDPRNPVSVYAGVIDPGVGRNGGYPAPEADGPDYELRLLAGRSGVWRGRSTFVEVQAARVWRSNLPDETRLDATLGVHFGPRWLVLSQVYAGRADGETFRSEWLKTELSVVRELGGDWRLQAGWRATAYGREAPADHGPVLALWRRF